MVDDWWGKKWSDKCFRFDTSHTIHINKPRYTLLKSHISKHVTALLTLDIKWNSTRNTHLIYTLTITLCGPTTKRLIAVNLVIDRHVFVWFTLSFDWCRRIDYLYIFLNITLQESAKKILCFCTFTTFSVY